MTVRCPAKVNLFLSVGPPDSKGYHPIRTVFQAVSLFDRLIVEEATTPSFACDDPSVPAENTVTKALRLVAEVAAVPPLKIVLEKEIPQQAGLGGGSSNAAGLLKVIDRFLPAPLPNHVRNDIALAVGADVPFFLLGGRARGEGYGERLEPLPEINPFVYLLWKPPFGCDTGKLYRALDRVERSWADFPADDRLYNDFERVAPCECLERIDHLKTIGAHDAGLTGSGSTVFGRFHSESEARNAQDRLPSEEFSAVVLPYFGSE